MSERTCTIEGCIRPKLARGWCKPHYRRWSKYGDPEATPTRDYWWKPGDTDQRCIHCMERKPLSEFATQPRNRSGRHTYCRKCQATYVKGWIKTWTPEQLEARKAYEKRQKARANFGLTFEQYDAMFADPKCAVCDSGPDGRWRRHHIDHDHATGKVRGLLCHKCNTALGLANDDPDRLRALAAYIEKHRGPEWQVSVQEVAPAT